MRKKLALLLALSMVLSMIPVTTFGANNDQPHNRVELSKDKVIQNIKSGGDGVANDYETQIDIGLDWLKNGTSFASLLIEVTGATYSTIGAITADPIALGAGFENVTTADVRNSGDTKTIAGRISLNFASHGAIVENLNGYISIPVTFNITNDDKDSGNIEVKVTRLLHTDANPGTASIDTTPATVLVARRYDSTGFAVSYGSKLDFADSVKLSDFTLTENVTGAFSKSNAMGPVIQLRLEIKTPYVSWINQSNIRAADVDTISGLKLPTSYQTAAPSVAVSSPTTQKVGFENNILTVEINIDEQSHARAGSFNLKNLEITADEKAVAGDVIVAVTYGSSNDYGENWSYHGDSKNSPKEFSVASFGSYSLGLTYAKDEKMDDYELKSGDYAENSIKFVLTELTPNSFTSGSRLANSRFEAPEGIRIQAANVSMYDASKDYDGDTALIKSGWRNAGDVIDAYDVRVTEDALTISRFNLTKSSIKYRLDVQLKLSIEPGYLEKYGDDEVLITFIGAIFDEVSVFDTDKKKVNGVVVATVTDRIAVEVDTTPFVADNTLQGVPIGDITITEVEVGELGMNKDIWVYVESPIGQQLSFTSEDPRVVNSRESGLTIGRKGTLKQTNMPEGIRFEITRVSTGDEPAVIVIPGGYVSGFIGVGIDYKIVVSGDAVANSNLYVQAAAQNPSQLGNINTYYRANPALFESGYTTSIFSVSGIPGVPGTAPDTEGPDTGIDVGDVELEPFKFEDGKPVTGSNGIVIENPFILFDPPGIGYLSVRVLRDMLPGATVGVIPGASGNVGAWISRGTTRVEMQFNSPTAYVYTNGSVSAENMTAGTGANAVNAPCILFEDSITYMPARFIAELFGYKVSYDEINGVASFDPIN